MSLSTRNRGTQTQLKVGGIVLKLNSKNLSTTVFLGGRELSCDFSHGKGEEGERSCLLALECEERYPKRRPYNRQSLPWGFLFYKSPEKGVRTDRSVCLENSGTLTESACTTKKQIHSLNVSCVGTGQHRNRRI